METIYTILIILGIVALIATIWKVIILSGKVEGLELIRLEAIDMEDRLDGRMEDIEIEIDTLTTKHKTLDKTINPNMDLLN